MHRRELLHRRLAGAERAADEQRLEAIGIEPSAQQADVLRRAADVHARDDPEHADPCRTPRWVRYRGAAMADVVSSDLDHASMPRLSPLVSLLRCLECRSPLRVEGTVLKCSGCSATYPAEGGTVRMVDVAGDPDRAVKSTTADSFRYEWEHFGALRPEWEHNFRGYLQPLEPEGLAGRLVLDVGAGSGRHSHQAARFGAQVVAVDMGGAIDVARANLPDAVLCVQADAEHLPFDERAFDVVLSIGVLHHLPDTERAVRKVARHVRPGGRLQIYLYWEPEIHWHRAVLRGVTAARRVTTRLPYGALRALCLPASALLWLGVVTPHRIARRRPRLRRLSASLPLKAYADYPFGVLINDQFDRLSAPLERRFSAAEVRALLESAGLEDVTVLPHHGWVAGGRVPEQA